MIAGDLNTSSSSMDRSYMLDLMRPRREAQCNSLSLAQVWVPVSGYPTQTGLCSATASVAEYYCPLFFTLPQPIPSFSNPITTLYISSCLISLTEILLQQIHDSVGVFLPSDHKGGLGHQTLTIPHSPRESLANPALPQPCPLLFLLENPAIQTKPK